MSFKKLYLFILGISLFISLYFITQMPEVVPVHWNSAGEIDGYGSRWLYVFLAVLPILSYLGISITRKIDPKQTQINRNPKAYELFKVLVSGFLLIINYALILAANNRKIDVSLLMSGVTGLMFIVLGNYMPRIPQNYFMGIKLPWTIENEYVWNKTHRLGGYCFIVCGFVMIIAGLFKSNMAFLIAILIIIGLNIGVGIYSYLLYQKVIKESK